MTLPNFLIIGAAKSGTSSLYMYLKQHPQIYLSPIKEPHFFSYDSKSKMTSGPGDFIPNAITDFEEYIHLFDGVKDEIAIGEASPTYLYREEAPIRIHALIPSVKIICILRDPAERAFSAYKHLVREHRETAKDFQEALALEEDRISKNCGPLWHFVNVGLYYQQLKRYYDLFDPKNILVLLQEDLLKDPTTVFSRIFDFLRVDPEFLPDSSKKYNISGLPKNKRVHKIAGKIFNSPNPIRWLSRKIIPRQTRKKFKRSVIQNNMEQSEIPENIREELLNAFKEDIQNLEQLINQDLSNWLN